MSAYGMYLSAEGAQAQAKQLEVLSNNLANVATPGFKRQLAIFQARYAEAIDQGDDVPGSQSMNDLSGGIAVDATRTDFSQGPMKNTGVPTDVAVVGDGFFMVDKNGEKLLTRAGNFRVTSEGQLVTQQGYSVLNDGGSAVTVDPESGPIEFTDDGSIVQGFGADRQRIGQDLAIVLPTNLDSLEHVGENLFRSPEAPQPATDRRVAPEFLEQSSVQPALEMMRLIETSRAFEANMSLIKQQDQMLGSLLNRVLRA